MNIFEEKETDEIRRGSRKTLEVHIPRFDYTFDVIQLRRYYDEENCVKVRVDIDGSGKQQFVVLARYLRKDEPEVLEELLRQAYLHLGIKPPRCIWD